jgi:hypothetical protein
MCGARGGLTPLTLHDPTPRILRQDGTPCGLVIFHSCPLRARSHGDSRGTTGSGEHKLTDRACEPFPAHVA